jgi:restriction system protein
MEVLFLLYLSLFHNVEDCMAVPKYDELMNPTLEAIHLLGGSASIAEIEESVTELLNLTNREANEIHRGN